MGSEAVYSAMPSPSSAKSDGKITINQGLIPRFMLAPTKNVDASVAEMQ